MADSGRLWGWIGRHVAPPRFLTFLLLLPAGAIGWHRLFPTHGWRDSLAMGFDGAAAVMLLSLLPLLGEVSVAEIRRRAAANDANQLLVLLLTTVLTLVVMSAITGELAGARAGHALAIVKLVATLLHCFAAFVFNIGIIAFTINALGGVG